MSFSAQKVILDLARLSVENFVKNGLVLQPDFELPDELHEKSSGVFVTIKQENSLRGCIGTIIEGAGCIKDDIIKNAVSAATKDPRFPPVTSDELDLLSYSVDVLKEPFKVDNISGLDPKRYGIIVHKETRQGVLLPDIEGVDTVYDQLNIACLKAGITIYDSPDIYAFEVTRYGEK